MDIKLYNVACGVNHIDKTNYLGTATTYSGSIKDNGSVSIDEPTVLLATSIAPMANYCYIDAFGRYYWIVNRRAVRTGLFEIDCISDPLMSFAASIKASPAVAARTEDINRINSYILDGMQPRQVNKITYSYQLGVFDYQNGCLVLATIGGR